MNVGKTITAVTARFGVVSRKAAMRLATETGKKMVDVSEALGRKLTTQEIEEVMAQTLPKKLRPKIFTTREEMIPFFERTGYTAEQAREAAYHRNLGAGCLPNGANKSPIFLPSEKYESYITQCELFSHELEHALERNNRLKFKVGRKLLPFNLGVRRLLDKNFMNKMAKKQSETMRFQLVQGENNVLNMFDSNGKALNPVLNVAPTQEGLLELNGLSQKRYQARLRGHIRKFANSKAEQSSNNSTLRLFGQIMDIERPAYTVEGEVARYARKIGSDQMIPAEGTAILYRDIEQLLKQEKHLYRKNKFLGKLKKPMVYQGDKDILKLAASKEDKKLLKEMLKGMGNDEAAKNELFILMKKNPQKLNNIKQFLEATAVDGKPVYAGFIREIQNINPEMLKNPDFVRIAKLTEEGYPIYANRLELLAETSPETLKRIADLAAVKGVDGRFKYDELIMYLDSPNFESLKKFADIEVNGKYPYKYMIYNINEYLNKSEIDMMLCSAQEAQVKGKDILVQLDEMFEAACNKQISMSLKKAEKSSANIFAK